MERKRKYPIGYKPRICLIKCTFKYYDKKYHNKLINKSTFKGYEKFIKVVEVPELIVILDDNNNFPSRKTNTSNIARIVSRYKTPYDPLKHNGGIRDISVLHELGRVNYEFDEFKH